MKQYITQLAFTLALLAILVMPLPLSADTTGTTTISGTLANTIAVIAPAGFSLTLDPSASQPIISEAKNVTVLANGSNTWNLKAHEAGGDGFMASAGTPENKLGSALILNVTGNVSLSNVAQNIVTDHAAGSDIISVTFRQPVTYTDPVHNDYAITVTFTVEFSP